MAGAMVGAMVVGVDTIRQGTDTGTTSGSPWDWVTSVSEDLRDSASPCSETPQYEDLEISVLGTTEIFASHSSEILPYEDLEILISGTTRIFASVSSEMSALEDVETAVLEVPETSTSVFSEI